MDKISIVGGSGFIGSELISSLEYQFQIINIDKTKSDIDKNGSVIADITKKSSLEDSIS